MSEKHLEAGQPLPPLKDGSVRLFSMKYCPFAQRSRLVLQAKGIDYEEINCNSVKRPEFLLERHPDGKVVPPFYQSMMSRWENEEAATKLQAGLTWFDAELKKRGTPFFGGQQPSMVDFHTWPFNERLMVSDPLMDIIKTNLPNPEAYFQRMVANPAVKAIINSKENHLKFIEGYVNGNYQYDF